MTGNHHFYINNYKIKEDEHLYVSMPYDGQSSFLLGTEMTTQVTAKYLCQCPMTGNHHFYEAKLFTAILSVMGVNAL